MTTVSLPSGEDRELVERLRRQAQTASDIVRQMAEDKSLRQCDNPEGRTDLYAWSTPDQTIEGRAANRIAAQAGEIERLRNEGLALADFIADLADGDTMVMAETLLAEATRARQALGDTNVRG